MNHGEHPYVSVDVRKHCPALKSACAARTTLPEPKEQYIIKLYLSEVNSKGTVCPYGVSRSIITNDGFPFLELADIPDRETPDGNIRVTLECDGCRHLQNGFGPKELTLQPRTLIGR